MPGRSWESQINSRASWELNFDRLLQDWSIGPVPWLCRIRHQGRKCRRNWCLEPARFVRLDSEELDRFLRMMRWQPRLHAGWKVLWLGILSPAKGDYFQPQLLPVGLSDGIDSIHHGCRFLRNSFLPDRWSRPEHCLFPMGHWVRYCLNRDIGLPLQVCL